MQLHQHLLVQGLEVLEDELAAQLLQLLSAVFLCHLGDFQNIIFVCVLGGNERSNSIFEILHEVEISHGQETPGILEAVVIWNPNSVDEVHNGRKDMWGALIHLEILVVVPNCSVELLQCFEVLGPGIEDNLKFSSS